MLLFNAKEYFTGQKDGNLDGCGIFFFEKNGPHLSCDSHKIGANLYSKLAVATFLRKTNGPGGWMDGQMDEWMGGWMDGGAITNC